MKYKTRDRQKRRDISKTKKDSTWKSKTSKNSQKKRTSSWPSSRRLFSIWRTTQWMNPQRSKTTRSKSSWSRQSAIWTKARLLTTARWRSLFKNRSKPSNNSARRTRTTNTRWRSWNRTNFPRLPTKSDHFVSIPLFRHMTSPFWGLLIF